ncbi:PREDICTED: zinc-finger homeodomain protein 3 [Erythranthe guttata]|nr:PREDICTED: zinc-finger homeodomain protein 3 [Erythranthe guttata]|eukprot:XP_012840257.1 PREDICTED: zinc-finger homeodomain protein 3 [Erythranthe guttata]
MVQVRYRECLKNHAASIGGTANDGCGEFMPAGEDGTLEALTCSACSCHRNFHRKEIDHGDDHPPPPPCNNCYNNPSRPKLFLQGGGGGHYHHSGVPPPPRHQMIMSYNIGGSMRSDQSDEQDGGGGGGAAGRRPEMMMKKRFRTKFSQEQKEKMLGFAERVGWRIQKQEESVVQSFCHEIGVKRRVLKVWMHNNKHTHLAASTNKNNNNTNHDQTQV